MSVFQEIPQASCGLRQLFDDFHRLPLPRIECLAPSEFFAGDQSLRDPRPVHPRARGSRGFRFQGGIKLAPIKMRQFISSISRRLSAMHRVCRLSSPASAIRTSFSRTFRLAPARFVSIRRVIRVNRVSNRPVAFRPCAPASRGRFSPLGPMCSACRFQGWMPLAHHASRFGRAFAVPEGLPRALSTSGMRAGSSPRAGVAGISIPGGYQAGTDQNAAERACRGTQCSGSGGVQ